MIFHIAFISHSMDLHTHLSPRLDRAILLVFGNFIIASLVDSCLFNVSKTTWLECFVQSIMDCHLLSFFSLSSTRSLVCFLIAQCIVIVRVFWVQCTMYVDSITPQMFTLDIWNIYSLLSDQTMELSCRPSLYRCPYQSECVTQMIAVASFSN